MERANVVIIGGGVYGTSIAYHLAKMGCVTAEEDREFDPDNYNEKADPPFVEHVSRQLSHRIPALDNAGFMRGWAGLITTNPIITPSWGKSQK